MTAPDPARTRRRIGELLVSLVVVLHITVSAVNYLQDTPLGEALRPHLLWWEKPLGVGQNWDMFAPNPPRSSFGTRVEVLGLNGQWTDRPAPTGPGDGPIRVRYWRGGKEIRSLYPKDSTGVRARFAANLCAQAETSGAPIVGVRFSRTGLKSVSPQDRRAGVEGAYSEKDLGTIWCRK